MNTDALIWMLAIQMSVTAVTIYFFYKVFKADRNAGQNNADED